MEQHVVFMNIPATGHMNPTLVLAKELCERHVPVTYFVSESVKPVVEATGATWRPFQNSKELTEEQKTKYVPAEAEKEDSEFPVSTLVISASCAPQIIEELKTLKPPPSVIIYDPFLPLGLVAAKELGIPCVSTVTVAGPGVIEVPPPVRQRWESNPVAQRAQADLKEHYHIDVFEHGSFLEFYSPHQNIVSTSKSLFSSPKSPLQLERFGHFPFECVGPMLNSKVLRLSNAEVASMPTLPEEVLRAKAEGKRILYLSAGTVATGHFWENKFGPQAFSNGLEESTGKDFVQQLFRVVFEAFGQDEEMLIVASTAREDALNGLELPQNLVAQQTLPQLELLPLCQAFITHGGANSVHESLSFRVPMVVVPIFGDQPANADTVERIGCGVSFRNPLETLTVEALREAVYERLTHGDVQKAVQEVSAELSAAGGAGKAAELVLQVAKAASGAFGGA